MKAEIKEKWIDALRSGKYKQTTGRLRVGDAYCCLGVLCDLYGKEHDIHWVNIEADAYTFTGERKSLTFNIMGWAGINTAQGCYSRGTLTTDNDNRGRNFTEIADIIEKHF